MNTLFASGGEEDAVDDTVVRNDEGMQVDAAVQGSEPVAVADVVDQVEATSETPIYKALQSLDTVVTPTTHVDNSK